MKKVFSSLFFVVCSVFSLLLFGARIGSNLEQSSHSASACFFNKYYSGGAEYNAKDINSVDINWIRGKVIILESDKKVLSFSEKAYSKKLSEDQKLHWRIKKGRGGKGKLIIEPEAPSGPNKWRLWKKSLPKKDLTVYVPKGLDRVSLNVVNSDCDFKESTAKEIYLSGVDGSLDLDPLKCDKIDVEGVALDLNVKLNNKVGYSVYRNGVMDGLVGKSENSYGKGNIKVSLQGVNCRLRPL